MNASERIGPHEDIKNAHEETLLDIRDGLTNIEKLAEQKANGADVAGALENAKEALFQRLAKSIADAEQRGVTKVMEPELEVTQDQTQANQDDYGGMLPERFEQTAWDKIKKGL